MDYYSNESIFFQYLMYEKFVFKCDISPFSEKKIVNVNFN